MTEISDATRAYGTAVMLIPGDGQQGQRWLHALGTDETLELIAVSDFAKALIRLREQRFDAVILAADPATGATTADRVRAIRGAAAGVAIVIATAGCTHADELALLEAGADEFARIVVAPGVAEQTAAGVSEGASAELIRALDCALTRRASDPLHPLATLIELSSDAIMTFDRNHHVTRFNAAAERIYGLAAADVIGQHAQILAGTAKREEQDTQIERIFAGESQRPGTTTRVRPDGTLMHLSISGWPIRDAAGRIVEICAIARDISDMVHTTQRLVENQLQIDISQSAAHVGSWVYDARAGTTRWSRELFRLYKMEPAAEPPSYEETLASIHPDDRATIRAALKQAVNLETRSFRYEFRMIRDPDDVRLIESRGQAITGADGHLRYLLSTVIDITDLRAEHAAREQAEEQARRFFDDSLTAMGIFDLGGVCLQANDAMCMLLRRPREQLLGRSFEHITHPDDYPEQDRDRRRMIDGGKTSSIQQKRYILPNGEQLWTEIHFRVVHTPEGEPSHVILQALDITARRAHELHLVHVANHDPLTGLLNRRGFMSAIEKHASGVQRYQHHGALLMIDLDNFKQHNDAHGHAAGDRLLIEVAQSLREQLRLSDEVARLGGDEFVVLLPEGDLQAAHAAAEIILDRIQEIALAHAHGDGDVVSASIGIAAFDPNFAFNSGEVIRHADRAMYEAKRGGRNRIVTYQGAKIPAERA